MTGLRSLGDPGYEVVQAAEAIEAGEYVGPRILASGPLLAATQTNAAILGWGEVTGRVEEGFDADLVVVDANPLESFRNLSDPHLVVARGRLIENPSVEKIDELDSVLDRI